MRAKINIRRWGAALGMVAALATAGCSYDPPIITATQLIEDAAQTLERFRRHKDLKEFATLLPEARAVIVLPQVIKAGFLAGGQIGNGIMVARTKEGTWSGPSFHTLVAASFGVQLGIQDTAVVMIVRSDPALRAILEHQGKLGADIGATVGFAGVGYQAATTTNLGADVLAFGNANMGAYLGGALDGAILSVRNDLNEGLYTRGATPETILASPPGEPATNRYWSTTKRLRDALGP